MVTDVLGNNMATIAGRIKRAPAFSHEITGEGFYTFPLISKRLSGKEDIIPVMISDRLVNIEELTEGAQFKITGQFRSHNKNEDDKRKLILFLFAKEIEEIEFTEYWVDTIKLEGYLCKKPEYRVTPLGRKITDFMLAVNRSYGKTDYIPCIAWERNAKYLSKLNVGSKIIIRGRVQSRVYVKKNKDGIEEEKTAYEVSAINVELCK